MCKRWMCGYAVQDWIFFFVAFFVDCWTRERDLTRLPQVSAWAMDATPLGGGWRATPPAARPVRQACPPHSMAPCGGMYQLEWDSWVNRYVGLY